MRILIDSNVLISSFIFDSESINGVFEIASREGNSLLIPEYVLEESRKVVERKWPSRLLAFNYFTTLMRFESVPFVANAFDGLAMRDEKDLPVLAAAIQSKADYLVTGDKDFAGVHVDRLSICTPAQFVALHRDH